jgi:hypothetical protein
LLDQKRRELQRHEDMVAKYGDSVHELEIQFEVKAASESPIASVVVGK